MRGAEEACRDLGIENEGAHENITCIEYCKRKGIIEGAHENNTCIEYCKEGCCSTAAAQTEAQDEIKEVFRGSYKIASVYLLRASRIASVLSLGVGWKLEDRSWCVLVPNSSSSSGRSSEGGGRSITIHQNVESIHSSSLKKF